jgi:hypothetical protein
MIRALLAAGAGVVLPGYFWAAVLRPACGLGERLAYSTVLSMGLVPVVAIVIARAAGTGITLWVAIASAAIVFGSGAILFVWKGPASKPISGLLPRPGPVRDLRVMALVAVVFGLALVTTLRLHGQNLLVVTPSTPRLLIVLTVVGLIVAGILVAWPRLGSPSPALPGEPRASAPPGEPRAPVPPGEPGAPAARPATAHQPDSDAGSAPTGPVTRTASVMSRATGQPRADATAIPRGRWAAVAGSSWVREGTLVVVLVLTGYRAYARVVRYEWPFIRGGDQFNHAVMAEQMLAHGSYASYLVYPPGFSALTAVVCRFADLSPLKVFPVLAPALLVLCSLGAYAVATRLWNWGYGIVAAALNGLVLTSAYAGFADGRYPDLVSAYFLMVMTVAALLLFYEVPSFRSGVIVTIAGSSVVLYHTVASLYLVLLLAGVAVIGLPYLALAGQRRLARRLLLALAAVIAVSAVYAAYIYNLPQILRGHASSTATVSQDLGSQAAPNPWHVLAEVSPPVIWLGLFGVVILLVGLRHGARPQQVLGALTVLIWCGLMYICSRTALDGFPVRFERDLGAPLSIIAALGVGVIVQTIAAYYYTRGKVMIEVSAYTAVGLAAAMALVQVADNLGTTGRPGSQIIYRPLADAGAWLARHNTGGNIISTPSLPGGSRTMLALGGYTGLQSYSAYRTANPRSLPTAGRQQLLDSRHVLLHPTDCRSAQILARNDVRFVVLAQSSAGGDLTGFQADRTRYRPVYQNARFVIFQPLRASCTGP